MFDKIPSASDLATIAGCELKYLVRQLEHSHGLTTVDALAGEHMHAVAQASMEQFHNSSPDR